MRSTTTVIALAFAFAQTFVGCRDCRKEVPSLPDESSAIDPPAVISPTDEVECPVCGLRFTPGEARDSFLYEGKRYHFLLPDHRRAFELDPKRYLDGDAGRWNPGLYRPHD